METQTDQEIVSCTRCNVEIDPRFPTFTLCTRCAMREHVEANGGMTRTEWQARVEARRLAHLEELREQAKRENATKGEKR